MTKILGCIAQPNIAPILAGISCAVKPFYFLSVDKFLLTGGKASPIRMRKQTEIEMIIFDLDGTVIDSSHRAINKPCGSIDLDHWRENCTAEKIAQDQLLPLAALMQWAFMEGTEIVVCTSRIMQDADFQFLRDKRLRYDRIIFRRDGDLRPCAEFKAAELQIMARERGATVCSLGAVMYEDNWKVIDKMRSIGIECYHVGEI